MDMHEEVAKFCKELDVELPPYREGIINPGAKSVKSLKDKAYRNVVKIGIDDYTLKDVNDMARCTITVDNYAQIPQLLRDLREEIPTLTGYISECENGYRGIHLNFTIDGFNTEIQIHTPEVAFTNQATEAIYSRWRSFDEKTEREKLAKKGYKGRRLMKKEAEIAATAARAAREYEACQTLYDKQNALTDFDKHKEEIRGVLDSFSYERRGVPKEQLPTKVNDVLSVKPHKNGSLKRRLLNKQAVFLNKEASIRQDRLIQIATQCRENVGEKSKTSTMRPIEKFFMEASKSWDKIFYGNIERRTGSKRSYNYLINRKKFSCLQQIYEYGLKNKMDVTNVNEVMRTFFNDPQIKASMNQNPTKYSEVSDIDIVRMVEFTIKEEIVAKNRGVDMEAQTKKVQNDQTQIVQQTHQQMVVNPTINTPKKNSNSSARR